MTEACNLAIETSGRIGSVTLGRGGQCLATAAMPEQERHRVDLMPTIDRLCAAHGVGPRQIAEVYLSIGPGSFTGLRIGVATAKMLAQVLGAKVVAVPTVEVIAQNVPRPDAPRDLPRVAAGAKQSDGAAGHFRGRTGGVAGTLLVCLNLKRDTVYAGRFQWTHEAWVLLEEPGLLTADDLLALPRPIALVGDPLPPAVIDAAQHSPAQAADLTPGVPPGLTPGLTPGLRLLPAELAAPHSQAVWRLGQALASRGQFTDLLALAPIYARQPEAVELWEKKLAADKRG